MAPRGGLPSFYKILLDPSARHLPLPTGFVHKHLENKIPENAILQSVNGGYSWRLKIKKLGENYCFVNGWNDVVEDSQLNYGDFLVFWLVDPSTFKFSIFSPSGCEKDFPVQNDSVNEEEEDDDEKDEDEYEEEEEEFEEEEDDDNYDDGGGGHDEEEDDGDEDDEDGGDIDGDDGDPFFIKIISEDKKYSLRLPMEFTRLAGIDAERTVIMTNLDGKEWPMSLRSEGRQNKSYYLSTGWNEFRRVNQLSEGDKCVIKFIKSEDKLCLARVTKKRVPAIQPTVKVPATEVKKRTRELPPHVEVESKDDNRAEVVKKKTGAEQLAGKDLAADVFKRTRGQTRRVEAESKDDGEEIVKKKLRTRQPTGKAPVAEVSKSLRRPPPRAEMTEKKAPSKKKLRGLRC